MRKSKHLVLNRERLRNLIPDQLGRVLGGEPTPDTFDLGCSFNCNTTSDTFTDTTNTTGNTLTNTQTDPLNTFTT